MTGNPATGLATIETAEAVVAPYLAGGVIERVLGAPEQSMDRIVHEHLGTIAMLRARGDTAPERPTYVFNPDAGLLINYAYRQNDNPARTGLFAEVVELKADGKPRYGVGVVNPFKAASGFIPVAVGENREGFAPSFTSFRLDDGDPTRMVPPNVETANLLALLGQQAIPADIALEDFVAARETERAKFKAKVTAYQRRSFPANLQWLNEHTNPDLHLIISDREDSTALVDASRGVGLYPLVVTGDEVLHHIEASSTVIGMMGEHQPPQHSQYLFRLVRRQFPQLETWLKENEPAFLSVDLPQRAIWDTDGNERWITMKTVRSDIVFDEGTQDYVNRGAKPGKPQKLHRKDILDTYLRAMVGQSPVFARLENNRLAHGEDECEGSEWAMVEKQAHGLYYHLPVHEQGPSHLEQYTDWLRKVKLDLALTMYLRGLSQL